MKHVRETIEELRRYIAENDSHHLLEEVDTLLSVALEDVRRKLTEARRRGNPIDLTRSRDKP